MTTEQQEMLVVARAAKDSGFKRVEIAPDDVIEMLRRIEELEQQIEDDRHASMEPM